jgi:Uma2 family endonuclease
MVMSVSKVPVLADDLEAFPDDGNRYEVIDGELFVTPPPSRVHQRVLGLLFEQLFPYGRACGVEVLFAPLDVRASSTTQVEPDILALPRHFEGRDATRWEPMSRLLLAVETLSPSTRRVDREVKRPLYVRGGVREYWIVDTDARSVEVWTPDAPDARVVRDVLNWQPVLEHAALTIDLVGMFREVHA